MPLLDLTPTEVAQLQAALMHFRHKVAMQLKNERPSEEVAVGMMQILERCEAIEEKLKRAESGGEVAELERLYGRESL